LLFESKKLQLKESIEELEKHLARLEKEIREITRMCIKPRMGEPTIITGHVTQQEQCIVDHIYGEITSWHETTKQVAEVTNSTKVQIEKMAMQLKRMRRETIDLMDGTAEHLIDCTLCASRVDRKVYHGQCMIGPQIIKLLAKRVEMTAFCTAMILVPFVLQTGQG
jgi:hypothetical protein